MLSPKLDPNVRFLLEVAQAQGNPPLESLSPVEVRKRASEDLKALGGTPELVHSIETIRISGPLGEIPIRIYTRSERRCNPLLRANPDHRPERPSYPI